MKFDFVYLGQTVLKYEVPLEIFVGLNEIYEKQKKQLPKANKQLEVRLKMKYLYFILDLIMTRCINIVLYHKTYFNGLILSLIIIYLGIKLVLIKDPLILFGSMK